MTQEQREEIEKSIQEVEFYANLSEIPCFKEAMTLARFARQQLNLRVDWKKFRDQSWERFGIMIPEDHSKILAPLVMECLTTEEKE